MSVLIGGWKMPVSCEECPCAYYTEGMHHDSCQAVREDNDIKAFEESRPDWCPLVEIPAHGRLIDADALWWNKRYAIEFDNEAGEHIKKEFFWAEDVAAAPTIVPAEDMT